MIAQVMRLATVFTSMMACSSFALAITIATAGIVERSNAGCYGCLAASAALKSHASRPAIEAPHRMQTAFGRAKVAALID